MHDPYGVLVLVLENLIPWVGVRTPIVGDVFNAVPFLLYFSRQCLDDGQAGDMCRLVSKFINDFTAR